MCKLLSGEHGYRYALGRRKNDFTLYPPANDPVRKAPNSAKMLVEHLMDPKRVDLYEKCVAHHPKLEDLMMWQIQREHTRGKLVTNRRASAPVRRTAANETVFSRSGRVRKQIKRFAEEDSQAYFEKEKQREATRKINQKRKREEQRLLRLAEKAEKKRQKEEAKAQRALEKAKRREKKAQEKRIALKLEHPARRSVLWNASPTLIVPHARFERFRARRFCAGGRRLDDFRKRAQVHTLLLFRDYILYSRPTPALLLQVKQMPKLLSASRSAGLPHNNCASTNATLHCPGLKRESWTQSAQTLEKCSL